MKGRKCIFALREELNYEQGITFSSSLTTFKFLPGVATCSSLFEFFADLETPGHFLTSKIREK